LQNTTQFNTKAESHHKLLVGYFFATMKTDALKKRRPLRETAYSFICHLCTSKAINLYCNTERERERERERESEREERKRERERERERERLRRIFNRGVWMSYPLAWGKGV